METSMQQLIQEQKHISKELLDKYMGLINHYRGQKKFPSTLTSSFVQHLILNPSYDMNVTIPLLEGARFNQPFRELLLIDVIKPAYLQSLFTDEDDDNAMIIDKFKIERKPLICAIFVNLARITDLDFVKVVVDNCLVHDFDYAGSNMIGILEEMIQNEEWLRGKEDERAEEGKGGESTAAYNLTNPLYMELIQ